MKLLVIPALLLAVTAGPTAPVRVEADGIRVGSELVTGAAMSLKDSGAIPVLVSGSVVESLSGETLAVSLDGKELSLGAGLRLTRVAEGFVLSSHGAAFTVEASGRSLAADRSASFKITDKGFDFGALGLLEGTALAVRATAAAAPAVAVEAPQQVDVSPERSTRHGRVKTLRRLYSSDPLAGTNAATSVATRQVGRVTHDGAP